MRTPGGTVHRRVTAWWSARRHASATRRMAVAARRPAYSAELAAGIDRFFEPERTCCPWCGSGRRGSDQLRRHLLVPDLPQGKPGCFRLDRCQRCGHIFQNPRLNADGLAFYYRDFYDGLCDPVRPESFTVNRAVDRGAAATLKRFAQPRSWLDVGGGYGRFCHIARTVWPRTRFDALDMSRGVELAQRRGWVNRGYRGSFVALAPELAGQYDVVSMFHYLEHTPEPQRELEAVRTVLRPGGYLLIDVPDPECWWATLLGGWWVGWLQPQHLHLFPVANLRQRLAELNFTVVLEQHAEADRSGDLALACWFVLNSLAPPRELPWLASSPTRSQRYARGAILAAGLPLLLTAVTADRICDLAARHSRLRLSNAYRLLARAERA